MENFALSSTNRTRPICKPVYFTEDEWLSVATKMAESDMPNFSAFCREMLLAGKVKHYDFSVIKEISSSLKELSGYPRREPAAAGIRKQQQGCVGSQRSASSQPQDAFLQVIQTCRIFLYAMTMARRYADASSQNQAACSSLPTIHR